MPEYRTLISRGITMVSTEQRFLKRGAAALETLDRTSEGAFHLDRARSLGTYITMWTDDEWVNTLGKPLSVGGYVARDNPDAIAIRGALLADPIKGALLIGHETVHSSMNLRGTAGSSAVNEGVAYSVEGQIASELFRPDLIPPVARGPERWTLLGKLIRDSTPMPPEVVTERIRAGERPYSLIF